MLIHLPSDNYPELVKLDDMIVLVELFQRTSMLISILAEPTYSSCGTFLNINA